MGAALVQHFSKHGHEVTALTRAQLDLSAKFLETALDPLWNALLNPAAISSPDLCEQEPATAIRVNALAPATLAAWAAAHDVRFVHFSTDYVFSGDHEGKQSTLDAAKPRTVYGITKRQGEVAVLATNPRAIVARISWIYGAAKPGFVDSVIARLAKGELVEAICDKFSLPTRMEDLASWLTTLMLSPAHGIVHACHRGAPISWHGLAEEIAAILRQNQALPASATVIARRLAEQSSFIAARPIHTAMDCSSLEQWIGPVSDWKTTLHDFVKEYVAAQRIPPQR